MAFKMKYKNLHGVVDELKGAVKAHGKQAKVIELEQKYYLILEQHHLPLI